MNYPSDIPQDKFEKIRPILESARKQTRPRTLNLHNIFNAVMYVVSTGCQWRALPKDYPKWGTVHKYFQKWTEQRGEDPTILDRVLKKIGRTRTYEKWKETMHEYGHRRRSECKEY